MSENRPYEKFLTNNLRLVYFPISNQEADWLWEDKEVRAFVKASKLYFLGQRQEIYFRDISLGELKLEGGTEEKPVYRNITVPDNLILSLRLVSRD